MDTWLGFLVAPLALLVVFVLYLGGAAVVLRLIEKLVPRKDAHERDLSAPPSAP